MTKPPPQESGDGRQLPAAPDEIRLTLSSQYLWKFILYGIPAMAVLSVLMTLVKTRSDNFVIVEIADRFILNNEASIPTVLSFLLMLTAAQLAFLAFVSVQKHHKTALNLYWLAAGLILIALAYDEAAQVHETIKAVVMREVFQNHGWIFVAMPVVLTVAVFFVPFLRSLPPRLAKQLIIAIAIFLSGAIVIEGIGGLYNFQMGKDLIYRSITVLEESVELVGISYLNIVLLEHAARQRISLRFCGAEAATLDDRSAPEQDQQADREIRRQDRR
ncbi:hypothetical protein [Parasedimentitalea psychrophila]|uniref:Uncharacterized protein n=1 Tax=Parasedimentitalea psychrophila TaxID=2997337 RepID=A0A9Y2L4B3_9RHOB|nr:hypothetical protein [Parasedimentitalea psychrophila]WIY27729.1 hypothetical protein QPJ95_23425 [Parasedimentitalea psychrophila]